MTQSNAMLRHVGKLAGLYPEDGLQALYCDETMDAVEDMLHHIVRTFGLEGDALEKARHELMDGWLTTFVKGFGEPSLRNAAPETRYQFERIGYFVADRHDCVDGALVFNRTVSLKDGWAKAQKKG